MKNCVLCHTPLAGDSVPFGFFEAHMGCHDDWVRENAWIERDRQDELERQEG